MRMRILALVPTASFAAGFAGAQPFDGATAKAREILEDRMAEGYHGGSSVGGKANLILIPDEGVVVAMLAIVSNHSDIGRDNVNIASAFAGPF